MLPLLPGLVCVGVGLGLKVGVGLEVGLGVGELSCSAGAGLVAICGAVKRNRFTVADGTDETMPLEDCDFSCWSI